MLKKLFTKLIFNLTKKLKLKLLFQNLIDVNSLESLLGFKIKNEIIYLKALTHRSFLEIHPELEKSNERLEFLGDAVLNMITAHYLFENFLDEEEGFLTKVRASIVNRYRLYEVSEKIQLKKYLLFNHRYIGDSEDGFKTVLADALEALIGAIFLDRGLKAAENFVLNNIIYPYEENQEFLIDTNYKGQLLEYTHANKLDSPKYVVVSIEGPEHKKEFTVDVYIGNEKLGTGKGKSKKSAEQNASRNALLKLKL